MFKRITAAVLAALLFSGGAALAQPIVTQTITTQNLSATGDCTAGACVVVDMTSKGGASVQVSGTYTASGGLSLQRTVNGSTWETITSNAFIPVGGTGTATITSAATGTWGLSGCVGFRYCRVTALGAVTGTATVSVFTTNASVGGTTSVSGGAGDASAANQVTGNNSLASIDGKLPSLASGRVPVTDLSAVAQGSTTSGQSGSLMQGAVTTAAPTYSTGQTSPLSLDTTGALRVNITAGAGSGGTASTVGSATPSTATAIGGNDGTNMQVPRVADVDSGAGTQYALVVSPRLAASGGAIEFAAGAGATSAGTLRITAASDAPDVAALGAVADAAATQGSTGSISAKLRTVTSQLNSIDAGIPAALGATTMSAAMPVTIATDDARIGIVTETAPASDTASSGLNGRLQRIAQNLTTLNTSVNADPNYTQAPGSAAPSRALAMGARSGANLVAVSQANATAAINVSTATTTQLVALSSGQVIHVTAASVVAGGTGNITFVYGTGTNCGTGTTSITGAYPLIANAGLSIGSGLGPVFVVPAGNALCVTTSAAVQMSGHVAYTQFTP